MSKDVDTKRGGVKYPTISILIHFKTGSFNMLNVKNQPKSTVERAFMSNQRPVCPVLNLIDDPSQNEVHVEKNAQ